MKADKFKESINASNTDIYSLYKVSLIAKLTLHFNKKIFGKEKNFLKDLSELHHKTFKLVKCYWGVSSIDSTEFTVKTTDGIKVELQHLLGSKGETNEIAEVQNEIYDICYKYDKNRQFKIIPVFENIIENFWLNSKRI